MNKIVSYLNENRGVTLNLGIAVYGFLLDPFVSGPVSRVINSGDTNILVALVFLLVFGLELWATPYKLSAVFWSLKEKGLLHGHMSDANPSMPNDKLGVLLFGSALFRFGIFSFILATGLRSLGVDLKSATPNAWIIAICVFCFAKETYFLVYAIKSMKNPKPVSRGKSNLGDVFYLLIYDFFFTVFFGGAALKSNIIPHPEELWAIIAYGSLAGIFICFFFIPLRLPYVLEEHFKKKDFKQWVLLIGSFVLAASAGLRPALTEVFDGRYTTLREARQAPPTNVKKLYLRRKKLTAVPHAIHKMVNLERLDLYNNDITKLSARIGQLKRLQRVNLMFNELTTLPKAIGHWRKVRVLKLYQNRLTSVPAELGQLNSLEYLDLRRNRLTTLPASLCRLKKLQKLYIGNNPMRSLPPCLRQLMIDIRRKYPGKYNR